MALNTSQYSGVSQGRRRDKRGWSPSVHLGHRGGDSCPLGAGAVPGAGAAEAPSGGRLCCGGGPGQAQGTAAPRAGGGE